ARLTHVPLPKEMFDYLDAKGILTFSEIPLWGFDQLVDVNNPLPKAWLKRLIANNYNHPSIAGWSVGNEIGDSPGVMEYVEDAIKYVRTRDTSRLAVMISHTASRPRDPIQFSDLGFINRYGPTIGLVADKIHGLHPEKVLFYSEFGYGQLREDLDANVDAKGMMDSIRFKSYLIGGSLWTFNDYRSSYVGTKEFSENRPWGIVDVFRQKKEAWYSFRKEYAPIRDLKIEIAKGNENSSANIIITPRKVLDLPAYTLKEYSLVWQACNRNNKIEQGGFSKLPVIAPGDNELQQSISWRNSGEISYLKIKLISPLNYSVCDTTVYFKEPAAPTIL
ncbi:MAG: glycoside hydrolase family 2 TIM barrel-domain containing protein, partial [Segetibacter sp.]